jgi:hypothetical protein
MWAARKCDFAAHLDLELSAVSGVLVAIDSIPQFPQIMSQLALFLQA